MPGADSSVGEQPPKDPQSPVLVCVSAAVGVSEPSRLSTVQALQAEKLKNLPLIKPALCNITYMSLHLTPIMVRKAQALFQPGWAACLRGRSPRDTKLPGQELGCISVRILPPSREAQWGFA